VKGKKKSEIRKGRGLGSDFYFLISFLPFTLYPLHFFILTPDSCLLTPFFYIADSFRRQNEDGRLLFIIHHSSFIVSFLALFILTPVS